MKVWIIVAATLIAIPLLFGGPVQAITIGFNPSGQVANLGNPVSVALTISDLGDLTSPSLSTFDLDVIYDPTILGFTSAAYGDPILGDQLDLFGLGSLTATTPGVGSVNLFELSFDLPDDLDNLQVGSFTLATITFDTVGIGTSSLGLNINALGDANGDPLAANLENGSISSVPEPSTLLLIASGLIGIATFRRKFTTL